jgi:hypothetical protein
MAVAVLAGDPAETAVAQCTHHAPRDAQNSVLITLRVMPGVVGRCETCRHVFYLSRSERSTLGPHAARARRAGFRMNGRLRASDKSRRGPLGDMKLSK